MSPNVKNRTLFTGDNLDVMCGINSDSVDLIYLDPPFNSNRNYAAPIGSEAAGAAFKDTWTLSDVDVAWIGLIADKEPALASIIESAGLAHGKGMKSYLTMMAVRLLEMRRVLKPTGSIYLHCDPTASHYLKLVMDCALGAGNFRNEIVWKRTSTVKGNFGQGTKAWPRVSDSLLYYSKAEDYTFSQQFGPYSDDYIEKFYRHVEPRTNRRYQLVSMTGPGGQSKGNPQYEVLGVTRFWRYSQDRMQQLIDEGLVVQSKPGGVPRHKYYLDEGRGVPIQSIWNDIGNLQGGSKERVGYPTQKPLALLERIIKASSNEGDVVLDAFCGCATALVAAETLGRQWVGIDLSSLAVKLVLSRLQKAADDGALLGGGRLPDVHHRTDTPQRTDVGKLPPYKTHRHTIYGKQEGLCAGCRHHFPFRNFTVDHIVPRLKGGTDHLDNLQLLCGACNSTKGTIDQAAFVAKLKTQGIRD